MNSKLIANFSHIFSLYPLLLFTPATAQPLPNSLPLPHQPSPTTPQTLPPLPEIVPNRTTPTPPILLTPDAIPGKIIVKRFELVGSTVFSQTEIDRILQPYTLRPISLVELLQVQREITQLYVNEGYLTSGAFIPPQVIEDRVVKIEAIEGKIEDIKIRGTKRLNAAYIRRRLEIATQPPLNQDKLLNALQLLQLDTLIANLSAELSTGVEPGSSLLQIDLEEADALTLKLSLDNQRSPSVGTNRRLIEFNHDNLLGMGDRLNAVYLNTDGSDSLNNLSYTLPVNPYNGQVKLAYSVTDSQIIEAPFNQLEIESNTSSYELSYRQPLYQTPTKELITGVTFSRQDSETSLLDFPFPLSRGANNRGETKISAIRWFQDFTVRDEQQVFAMNSQFSIGIDAFDATVNQDLPDSKFFVWRGQAQYLRMLTPNLTLLLRSELQFANDDLLSLEQFSAGGGLTVRGYRQDTLLGDNGLFTSAELRTSVLRIPQWQTTLELVPFADFATVWNTDNSELAIDTISSVGLGVRLLIGDNFTARLDWGIPLVEVDAIGNSLQEDGIHFALELIPF